MTSLKKSASALFLLLLLAVFGLKIADYWQHYLYPLEHAGIIEANARRNGVDPYLIAAIIYQESRFRPGSQSRAGAVGLMQIMPDTALWISQKTRQSVDSDALRRPDKNIALGSWYFSWLQRKYGSESLALAAYNSGDKTLDRWLRDRGRLSVDGIVRSIPYPETRNFVQNVQASREQYKRLYPDAFKGT